MKPGNLFFTSSILIPLLLGGYYFLSIPMQAPPLDAGSSSAAQLVIPVSEGGTNYILASIFGFLIGLGFLGALYACRNKSINLRRGKRPLIILGAIAVMAMTFTTMAMVSLLVRYKAEQFWHHDKGHALTLNAQGIEVPFALIHGDIMPPLQRGKTQEYMLFNNKPFLFVPWDHITHWVVSRHRNRYTTVHLYELSTSDMDFSIDIDRYRIQAYDQAIIHYASDHLHNRVAMHDEILK